MNEKQIAQTILEQLGGNKMASMIGAYNFLALPNGGLGFKFKAHSVCNYLRIDLNSSDLYNIKALKIRGSKIKEVASKQDVYAEDLVSVCEQITGLYFHL